MPRSTVALRDSARMSLPRTARAVAGRLGSKVRHRVRWSGRPVAVALALALLLGLVELSAPVDVAASNGYSLTGSANYVLNPAAGSVEATVTFQLRNTTPNQGSTRYYFESLDMAVEDAATNLRATADAGTATISRVGDQDALYDRYRVRFSAEIFYGATRRLTITYRVPGGAPRSDSFDRIGRAYAAFCVIGHGPDGGSVTVTAPAGFDFRRIGGGGSVETTTKGDVKTYQAKGMADAGSFWSCFAGTDPAGYTTSTIRSPSGREIAVESWPEDATWRDQVTAELSSSVVGLERLVGRGLAGTGRIVVREVGAAGLGWYAGAFDSQEGIAYISEEVEAGVIPHELAHSWFNAAAFAQPWLSEGSASWAEAEITGDGCEDPGPPSGSASLSSWTYAGPFSKAETFAAIQYQYRAACWVFSEAARDIEPDRMRAVLAAMLDGVSAYQSGDSQLKASGKVAWREWVDAIDELGHHPAGRTMSSDEIKDLLLKYKVISVIDAGSFAPRGDARAKYHELAAALGTEWTLPEVILRAMAEWRFVDATKGITSAGAAWAAVRDTERLLPEAKPLSGPVRTLFEAAYSMTSLSTAEQKAINQRTAAELVAAARTRVAAPRMDVARLGLVGQDLTAPVAEGVAGVAAADLERARSAVAEVDRLLGEEAAAAASMTGARERLDAPRDPLVSIGLIGSDLEASFATGLAAVGAVDPAGASAAAAAIDGVLAGASEQGLIRVVVALAVLMLMALVAYLARRRWDRRRVPASAALAVTGPMAAVDATGSMAAFDATGSMAALDAGAGTLAVAPSGSPTAAGGPLEADGRLEAAPAAVVDPGTASKDAPG